MIVAIIIFLLTVLALVLYMIYSVYKLRKLMERKISEAMRDLVAKSLPPLSKWIYNKYFKKTKC
jgi:flagellar biogenesis protein FliO